MDLTSLHFLFLFLPLFILLYLVPHKELRLLLITIASLVFLAWGGLNALRWLSLILVTAYFLGLSLSSEKGKGQAIWLWIGVGINLGLLSLFKLHTAYGPELVGMNDIPDSLRQPFSSLTVPIGISFVTFQAISYLVDVWRGTIPAERNLLRFAAYLFFFPKLVSGPLMRYGPFVSQINEINPSMGDIAAGLRRLFVGFIKRTLIANQVAVLANAVFNLPLPTVAPHFAWLALLAYALQIYFDFAGYTDMAIGLGLMVGIRLPENFNHPYTARNVSDFWRRWHMTLTAWFREYVFYPLERRRFRWGGQQLNILIVFALTGLWHGFRPSYLAWGLLHGLVLAMESLGFGRWLSRLWRPLQHIYALIIVLMGWVLFRSDNLPFAAAFFRRLAGDTTGLTPLPFSQTTPLPFVDPSVVLAMIAGILFSIPLASLWSRTKTKIEHAAPATQILFQAANDLALIALFIIGLAASLSRTFLPNIYAAF